MVDSGIRTTGHREAWRPLALALVLLAPASLLAVVAAGAGTLAGDVSVAREVQSWSFPGAQQAAWLGYVLGGTAAATLVGVALALVLFWRGKSLSVWLMAFATIAVHLNYPLKWLIESPRPTADQVRVTEVANFYGFPSGHVMTAVIIYGAAFALAPVLVQRSWVRVGIRAGSVAAILVTSFGRIYSGAHWPTDVAGGYLWGAILLLALLTGYRVARARRGVAVPSRPVPARRERAVRTEILERA